MLVLPIFTNLILAVNLVAALPLPLPEEPIDSRRGLASGWHPRPWTPQIGYRSTMFGSNLNGRNPLIEGDTPLSRRHNIARTEELCRAMADARAESIAVPPFLSGFNTVDCEDKTSLKRQNLGPYVATSRTG